VAGLAGLFYGLAGQWAFVNGAAILILAQLYSWKPIRLKALPVVDVVSHILMLSGLLLLAAYMAYDPSPTEALTVATSVTLMSAYGQLYNQLRDFEADQAAGLRNTASFLGQQLTIWLSYACVGVAALTLAWAILVEQIFPFWLAGVVIVVAPAVLFISRGRDMRGDTAAGVQGDAQVQFLVIANLVLLAWLGVALVQG
jgi:4-hydroxybenzoate polyprenyltransferase